MNNILKIIGILLVFVIVGWIGKLLLFPATVVKNTLEMPTKVNNAVMDADRAIYNYEWFKQQEADIKRLHSQEVTHQKAFDRFKESLPKSSSDWSFFQQEEYQRLSANITAQEDMVNRAIENYNAKSSMVSKNIFKDNLPSNLTRSFYAQKDFIIQ